MINFPAVARYCKASLQAAGMAFTYSIVAESLGIVVDEPVIEQRIVQNIKRFIMTLGRDFAFVGNQYHLEVFGEEMKSDLLFFNRELNALVVIELKKGKFKPAYLGQLYAYMQVLDDKVRKPHENPCIGIVLCRSANQAYAEYAVRDYNKPMGVSTYKTLSDMPTTMQQILPDVDEMMKLMDDNGQTEGEYDNNPEQ